MNLITTTLALGAAFFISFSGSSQCIDYGNDVLLPATSSHTPNYLLGSAITVPVSGTLTTVSMIAMNAGPNYQVAVYDNAGGNPGNLLTSASGVLAVGTNLIDVPDVTVTAGTYYMVAVFDAVANIGYEVGGTETVWYIAFTQGSALPDPFGTPLTYTGQIFNFYFEVCTCTDAILPTASNPISVDAECIGDVLAPDVLVVTDEMDNSGVAPIVAFVGDVSDSLTCPETITRTYSVTDDCGNEILVDQLIYVQDLTAPVADNSTLPDLTGECSVDIPNLPKAVDNCLGTIDGVPNVTFPIPASGTTVVTWTYTDDCGNTIDQTQNVIVTDIDNSVTVNNNVITATATGYFYQWVDCDNGNTPIALATNQSYTALVTGNYAVEISDGTCTVTSDCSLIDFTGLNDLQESTVEIFPNPATEGEIHFTGIEAVIEVKVIDMLGRAIHVNANLTNETINVSSLEDGKYILQIFTESGSFTKEFVVIN